MLRKAIYKSVFLKSFVAYLAIVLLFSAAFFYRPFVDSEYFQNLAPDAAILGPGFFSNVLLWQGVVWLPWVAVFTWLGMQFRAGGAGFRPQNLFLLHLVTSGIVATLGLLWFRVISIEYSPFLGFETTALGVFLWFHMAWFVFGFAFYWAAIGILLLQRTEVFSTAEEIAGKHTEALFEKLVPTSNQLVLKVGKKSIVLGLEDIIWIESQEYYSVIHTKDEQHWVKISLGKLQEKLKSKNFVRVHRANIINTRYLKEIKTDKSDNRFAVLKNGETRPVSRKGWVVLENSLKAGV